MYHFAPYVSYLQTGIRKCLQDYVGTLVIDTVLDSTCYKQRDSENRVLLVMFHMKRLKLAFVSTPASTVNTQKQLNIVIQGMNATNSIAHTGSNTISLQK